MLPDFYTWWDKLGESDQDYLENCWGKREWGKIEEFMEGYRLSLCRGSIKFGARGKLPRKKFSWTRFRVRIYMTWTELNTPRPKKITRDVPISRISHFLTLLRLPSHTPTSSMKDYITLFILQRDHGKNISDERVYR
jgi:hypothetical protein